MGALCVCVYLQISQVQYMQVFTHLNQTTGRHPLHKRLHYAACSRQVLESSGQSGAYFLETGSKQEPDGKASVALQEAG